MCSFYSTHAGSLTQQSITALQSTGRAGWQPPVQVQGGRGRCQRHPRGRRGEGGLQDHRGGGQQGHLDQGHPGQVEPGAGPADEGAQVAEAEEADQGGEVCQLDAEDRLHALQPRAGQVRHRGSVVQRPGTRGISIICLGDSFLFLMACLQRSLSSTAEFNFIFISYTKLFLYITRTFDTY